MQPFDYKTIRALDSSFLSFICNKLSTRLRKTRFLKFQLEKYSIFLCEFQSSCQIGNKRQLLFDNFLRNRKNLSPRSRQDRYLVRAKFWQRSRENQGWLCRQNQLRRVIIRLSAKLYPKIMTFLSPNHALGNNPRIIKTRISRSSLPIEFCETFPLSAFYIYSQ